MSFAYVRNDDDRVLALRSTQKAVPAGQTEVSTALEFNPIIENWSWTSGGGFVNNGLALEQPAELPPYTTAKRDELTEAELEVGDTIFNTDTLNEEIWDGTSWSATTVGLSAILAKNNTTSGTDIVVSNTDQILTPLITGNDANGDLTLKGGTNSPKGGSIVFVGGSGATDGGDLRFRTGFGNSGSGGNFEFIGEEGTNGNGGGFTYRGGNAATDDGSGVGGGFDYTGGDGGFDSGDGGSFNFLTGTTQGGTGASGSFTIDIGSSFAGLGKISLAPTRGDVNIGNSAGTTNIIGNLTVTGTTTTIDSTTVTVEDKNIELGVVSIPTDITANGGGITLKGTTDKTIIWDLATAAWKFNQNVHVHTGSAGSIGPTSSADDLTVENDADAGITILTPDANTSALNFGSPNRQTGAFLRWQNSAGLFTIGTGDTGAQLVFATDINTEAMRIDEFQRIGIGKTPSALLDVAGNVVLETTKFLDGSTQTSGSTPDGIGFHPSMISASLQSTTLTDEDTAPVAIFVRADGLKLYMTGNVSQDIFEYDMTIPWDLSTLSFLATRVLNLGAPRGLFFKPDGTKFYVCRFTSQVTEFTMSTPWDVTSVTGQTGSFTVTGGVQAMTFKADGTSLYILDGNNNLVLRFDMTTPWDLDTASNPSISFDYSNEFTGGGALTFRSDGRSMYAGNGTILFEYELSTPWDITTARPIDSGTIVNGEFLFSPDGTKAIGLDRGTDLVHRFDIGISTSIAKAGISEAEVYRFLDGSEQTAAATENNSAGHFELNKKDGSLDVDPQLGAPLLSLFVSEDGMQLFVAGNEPVMHRYEMTAPWDITTASNSGNQGTFVQSLQGIFVSPDGTRVITMASDGNIRTWELSTPFDLSTNTEIAFINLPEGTSIISMYCSKDGRRFYTDDSIGATIRQYEMGTPYDTSTLVFTGQTFATGTSNGTQSIWFRDDGRRMYFRFAATVREYTLTTPWDISTAVLHSDVQLDGADANVREIVIKNDGSVMFAGSTDASTFDRIDQYDLGLVTSNIQIDGERASRIAPQTIEIFTSAQLDDLATAGVITISSQTAIILKANITTSNRFDVESGNRFTIGNEGQGYSLTYDGSDTFITSIDSIIVLEASLVATGGGTLFDVSGQIGTIINVDFTLFTGWKIGTIRRSPNAAFGPDVFFLHMSALNWQDTLTLENVSVFTIDEVALIPFAGAGVPFVEIKGDAPGSYTINLVSGDLAAGESLIRIDPGIADASAILVTGSTVSGTLFDTTGFPTGTFTAVTDASVSAEAITSVTNSSGVARFNFTAPPTLFVNQEVVISTFTTNTDYNGTFLITATGANFFEVASIAFGSNETGSFLSNSITLAESGTVLVDGDTLVVDTDSATDYDGGAIVYNQLTNSFQISRVYDPSGNDPQTGLWDANGIDQKDPRVLASNNPGSASSEIVAFGSMNGNTADVTPTADGTYGPLVVTGFLDNSVTERLKLIDADAGIYEYIGNEPCSCFITAFIWATKTGSTGNYRFALSINGAIPIFASADYSPMEMKTTKVQSAAEDVAQLVKGDTIQWMVAGDGTADDPTITDFKMRIK